MSVLRACGIKKQCPEGAWVWKRDTPLESNHCERNVRLPPRSLTRCCRGWPPLWRPLSRPSVAKNSTSMPIPPSVDYSRIWHAKMSNRSRIALAKIACPCNALWAGLLGRRPPCGRRFPHGWRAGDDEMGRPYGFRRRLDGLGERSMLAVPGNTLMRDLETAPPEHTSRGRRPQRPWPRVEAWSASLEEGAWKRIDVRDGSQGPLVVDVVKRRVVARTPRRQQGDEALVVVLRYRDRDHQQVVKVDFYLSNAEPGTSLWQLARVAKA